MLQLQVIISQIYLYQVRYIPPGPAKPCLKIWNGAAFTTYEFTDDSAHALGIFTVLGNNKGWCNTFHFIYYFDNGIFTSYYKEEIIGGEDYIIQLQMNFIYLQADLTELLTRQA